MTGSEQYNLNIKHLNPSKYISLQHTIHNTCPNRSTFYNHKQLFIAFRPKSIYFHTLLLICDFLDILLQSLGT